jgi:hypothetical protein
MGEAGPFALEIRGDQQNVNRHRSAALHIQGDK